MYDPVFDPKTQAAKSSIDAALGVAQRVQQRMGMQAQQPVAPAPQGMPAPGMQPRPPQPMQQPQQPGTPQMPQAWPTMPGANPLLQQLMQQYATRPQPMPGAPPQPVT